MSAILIIGHCGFIGKHCAEALHSAHTLYGLDIAGTADPNIAGTLSWNDLGQAPIPDIDTIIHLAGNPEEYRKTASLSEYYATNTGLVEKAFRFFTNTPSITRFIFFSSIKAVGPHPGHTITEQTTPEPQGHYANSKRMAEQHILDQLNANPHQYTGRQIIILRPCLTHGPGNRRNLLKLYNHIARRLPWPLGAYPSRRSYLAVENLTFILSKILRTKIPNGIYNLADDQTVETQTIIRIIGNTLGIKPIILRIPPAAIVFAARVGTALKLPLNTKTLEKISTDQIVSNQKIKTALRITNLPLTATQGIQKTITSYRE